MFDFFDDFFNFAHREPDQAPAESDPIEDAIHEGFDAWHDATEDFFDDLQQAADDWHEAAQDFVSAWQQATESFAYQFASWFGWGNNDPV